MNIILLSIVLGLCAGGLSGFFGIGGGIIIIPSLVFFLGFSQQQAQGTTLALMVPPIGLLAAWTYYKNGFVDLKVAAFICAGFIIGSLLGAKFAVNLSHSILQKSFGIILIIMGIYFFIKK